MSTAIVYPRGNCKKEVMHTLSFIWPVLKPGDTVLDIGCGYGWVAAELRSAHEVKGVDIVDMRLPDLPKFDFDLYDGQTVPCPDNSFDVVLLTFVLHHVPNELKVPLVREARRVTRRNVVVLEDTPRNALDRWACNIHGRSFRKRIGSTADFGFYAQARWEEFFVEHDLKVASSLALPRFGRDLIRPWARSAFVLEKS